MCVCTPILATEEQMRAEMDAVLSGDDDYQPDYSPIEEYPEGFQQFVDDNADDIEQSYNNGTAPYFIQNNPDIIEDALNGELPVEGREAETKQDEDEEGEKKEELPKTLQHLDEAIAHYRYTDPNLKAREKDINAKMKELFDRNDFGMDVKLANLESIMDKGFLNTFQTGTSGGYKGSPKTSGLIEQDHARLAASHRMFSDANAYLVPNPNLKREFMYTGPQYAREDYEKYGYLVDSNKTRSFAHLAGGGWYGDVQVRFKKDSVRCTWTFEDSLVASGDTEYFQPSLVDDPKVKSFDKKWSGFYYTYKGIDKAMDTWLSSDDWNSVPKFTQKLMSQYIELQYHGRLTFDDVASITLGGNHETLLSKETIGKIKDKGVEIWYLDGKRVKKYKYQ